MSMKKTAIWKFKLSPDLIQKVTIPECADCLSVGLDPRNNLCLWAAVPDIEAVTTQVTVYALPTGNGPLPPESAAFLGTVKDGSYMVHIWID